MDWGWTAMRSKQCFVHLRRDCADDRDGGRSSDDDDDDDAAVEVPADMRRDRCCAAVAAAETSIEADGSGEERCESDGLDGSRAFGWERGGGSAESAAALASAAAAAMAAATAAAVRGRIGSAAEEAAGSIGA